MINISLRYLIGVAMEEREEGMYERAKTIQDLCDSDFASDKELEVLSQEFYFDFGCHWTEILDK